MDRQDRRASLSLAKSHLRKVNRSLSDDFVELTRENWPHDTEPSRFAVYRSKRFLVQAFNEGGGVIRLSVNEQD
jgi:hypothetical protein